MEKINVRETRLKPKNVTPNRVLLLPENKKRKKKNCP
jgi:hypothetical protein